MNTNNGRFDEYDELMASYINGRLSDEQKIAFEKKLETIDGLREELEFRQMLSFSLNNEYLLSVAQQLLELKEESLQMDTGHPPPSQGSGWFKNMKGLGKNILLISVPIAILLFAIFHGNFFLVANCDQLYTRYIEPYPAIFLNGSNDLELKLAIDYYERGDYERAGPGFFKASSEHPIFLFYYAVTRMYNFPEEPRQNLIEFSTAKKGLTGELYKPFIPWIDYYMALIEFKEDNFKEGKEKIRLLSQHDDLDLELETAVKKLNRRLLLLRF